MPSLLFGISFIHFAPSIWMRWQIWFNIFFKFILFNNIFLIHCNRALLLNFWLIFIPHFVCFKVNLQSFFIYIVCLIRQMIFRYGIDPLWKDIRRQQIGRQNIKLLLIPIDVWSSGILIFREKCSVILVTRWNTIIQIGIYIAGWFYTKSPSFASFGNHRLHILFQFFLVALHWKKGCLVGLNKLFKLR